MQHVGRHGNRAVLGDIGDDRFDDLDVEIGGGKAYFAGTRLDEDVGQYRYGIAPLDLALHMRQRLEKCRAVDRHAHLEHLSPSPDHIVGPKNVARKAASRKCSRIAPKSWRYCCSINLISRATSRANRS